MNRIDRARSPSLRAMGGFVPRMTFRLLVRHCLEPLLSHIPRRATTRAAAIARRVSAFIPSGVPHSTITQVTSEAPSFGFVQQAS